MTVKEQILQKYKTVREFTKMCHDKYGIRALTLAEAISRDHLTKKVKHVLIQEGINIAGNVEPEKDYSEENAEYLKNLSKQIKNWRAGL